MQDLKQCVRTIRRDLGSSGARFKIDKIWACNVCGEIREAATRPGSCKKCGKNKFELDRCVLVGRESTFRAAAEKAGVWRTNSSYKRSATQFQEAAQSVVTKLGKHFCDGKSLCPLTKAGTDLEKEMGKIMKGVKGMDLISFRAKMSESGDGGKKGVKRSASKMDMK